MRQLIVFLFIWTTAQCYGETFDLDTIDNWQIYNGTDLVFGGHDSPLATEFQGTIELTDLSELVIQFNHCVRYTDDVDVTIELIDGKGKNLLIKKFKNNAGTRMIIYKKELEGLILKSIIVRYREIEKMARTEFLDELFLRKRQLFK